MKQETTRPVCIVTVIDPDSGGEVEVEIRKTESGAMVGLDGAFLQQSDDEPFSPYDEDVQLIVPVDKSVIVPQFSLVPASLKSSLQSLLRRNAQTEGCDDQASLRDLLTDLQHLANAAGLDFGRALAGASAVATEEHEEMS